MDGLKTNTLILHLVLHSAFHLYLNPECIFCLSLVSRLQGHVLD